MKILKRILIILFVIIVIAAVSFGMYGYTLFTDKIKEQPLADKVADVHNSYDFVPIEEVPDEYIDAIIAVEDHRYNEHGAIDIVGLGRAILTNITSGELREGGSTITQQVAKNLYFISEETVVRRKIAEMFMAIELENKYSKDEILELYINTIYFGDGYYGIKQACEGYLNKEPCDMNLAESTMMAGIPNAPSAYAPTVNATLCMQRQKKVISSMVENGYLTEEQADSIDQSFIQEIYESNRNTTK